MVSWRRVQRPKHLGELGVLDLVAFNRALRMRWQWLKWKNNSKPWSEMTIHHTPISLTFSGLAPPFTWAMVSALASCMTVGCRGRAQKRSHPIYTSLHDEKMRQFPPT